MRYIIAVLYIIHIVLAHTPTVQHSTAHVPSTADPGALQTDHAELRDDDLPDNAAESIVSSEEKPAENVLDSSTEEKNKVFSSKPSDDARQNQDNQEEHNADVNGEGKKHAADNNLHQEAQKEDKEKIPKEIQKDAKEKHDKVVLDGSKDDVAKKSVDISGTKEDENPTAKDIEQKNKEIPQPQRPNNVIPAPEIGRSRPDNQAIKQDTHGKIADQRPEGVQTTNTVDDDDGSSPTVVWFVLFSVVIVVSVAAYLRRSGLRAPSSLGFEPVPRHSNAEEVPLMTPVDQIVSAALLNLRVPASAVDKYVQAFHNQRISRVEQLDDSTWKKLALPSAIELELRRRFEEASIQPRSAGLASHRDNGSRSGQVDDMEFDDWSFDDEEINDNNI